MSISSKPQISEAVVFFDEQGQVCRQMRVPEFDAVLDGIVTLGEYKNLTMRCAYVLINSRLMVRSAVFFIIRFDEGGAADPAWNLPLRKLADKAGRGPDLGAGPIRLACHSQCPIESCHALLWDASADDLNHLRNVLKRNVLGFLTDEDLIVGENLQVVSEERWFSAPVTAPRRPLDADQRSKAAKLIKLQRQRIKLLHQTHQENIQELRQAFEQELLDIRMAHQELLQVSARQVAHIERLEHQLETQVEESERLAQRLYDLKQQSSEKIAQLTKSLEQQAAALESSR